MFITLEGGEGSGKSTQARILAEKFRAIGRGTFLTHEPGGTVGAEEIRKVLLGGDKEKWDAISELLLFFAARRDHVEKAIKPALSQGKIVICDRFTDSTLAYQCYAKGVAREVFDDIHRITLTDFKPNITFLIDIEPSIGLERASRRKGGLDRIEAMEMEYHQAIRSAFLDIAESNKERFIVVDGRKPLLEINDSMFKMLKERIEQK